jgi:hypothetical protein
MGLGDGELEDWLALSEVEVETWGLRDWGTCSITHYPLPITYPHNIYRLNQIA